MKRWLLLPVLLLAAALGQAQQLSTSASLTAAVASCVQNTTACLILPLVNATNNSTGATTISLQGTWVATVQFEASPDHQATWAAVNGTPIAGTTAVTNATGTGIWQVNVSGLTDIRVRVSAFTSGTVLANIQASTASASKSGSSVPAGSIGATQKDCDLA